MANFNSYMNGLTRHNPLSLVGYNMEIAFGKHKIYDVTRSIPNVTKLSSYNSTYGNPGVEYNSFIMNVDPVTNGTQRITLTMASNTYDSTDQFSGWNVAYESIFPITPVSGTNNVYDVTINRSYDVGYNALVYGRANKYDQYDSWFNAFVNVVIDFPIPQANSPIQCYPSIT